MKRSRGRYQSEIQESLVRDRHRQIFADVHCHCLPNFDGGPSNELHAPASCRQTATDAHNTTARASRMTKASRRLVQRLGGPAAQLLCVENPRRLITGQDLVVLNETWQRGARP